MPINYRTVSNFDDYFVDVIDDLEGFRPDVHDVLGVPHVGYGFNTRIDSNLFSILTRTGIFDAADLEEEAYRQEYGFPPETDDQRISRHSSMVTHYGNLDTQHEFSNYTNTVTGGRISNFSLDSDSAALVVSDLINGHSSASRSFTGLKEDLNNWMSVHDMSVPSDTYEYAALLSLAYNGYDSVIGPNLFEAMENGDRLSAWIEIRSLSNGNDLAGLAKRRFYEANLFGGPSQDLNEYHAFSVFTLKRDKIIENEAEFGGYQGGPDQVVAAREDYGDESIPYMSEVLQPYVDRINQKFGFDEPFAWDKILVAKGPGYVGPTLDLENVSYNQGSFLLIGGSSSSGVYGGDGDDHLWEGIYGEPLILTGRGGNDTYHYFDGDDVQFSINDGAISSEDTLKLHGVVSTSSTVDFSVIAGEVLKIKVGENTVQIRDGFEENSGIEFFEFSDQTLTIDDVLLESTTGTNLDDTISGSVLDDVITGRQGNDKLYGGLGDDTYLYHSGDGSDVIDDFNAKAGGFRFRSDVDSGVVGGSDRVVFSGLASSEVKFDTDLQSLYVKDLNDQVLLDIKAFMMAEDSVIEEFEFSDGIVLTADEVLSQLNVDRSGDDSLGALWGSATLLGGEGDDSLRTGVSDDYANGGPGDDRFLSSYGRDLYEFSGDFGFDTFTYKEVDLFFSDESISELKFSGHHSDDFIFLSSGDLDHPEDSYVIMHKETGSGVFVVGGPPDGSQENEDILISFAGGADYNDDQARQAAALSSAKFYYSSYGNSDVDVEGTGGSDVIKLVHSNGFELTNVSRSVYGYNGDDHIYGGLGNDKFYGGLGDDYLVGAEGDDQYIYLLGEEQGHDTILDSDGVDRIRFQGAYPGYSVESDDIAVSFDGEDLILDIFDSAAHQTKVGSITIKKAYMEPDNLIEEVTFGDGVITSSELIQMANTHQGTDFVDNFELVNDYDHYVSSLAGNDSVVSGSGSDHILAGDGNDLVYSGLGNDHIKGGQGDDRLFGEDGRDSIFGGLGSDTIDLGSGDGDFARGGSGDDTISGLGGDKTVFAESGEDSIIIDSANNSSFNHYIVAGTEADSVTVLADMPGGFSTIQLGQGNDQLTLSPYIAGSFYLNEGDDFVEVLADESFDSAELNSISRFWYAGDGNNSMYLSSGKNTVTAGAGVDYVETGSGEDFLEGGMGNDELYSGGGRDVVHGDGGDDLIDVGTGYAEYVSGGSGDDSISGQGGDKNIFGDSGSDDIVLNSMGLNDFRHSVYGGAGSDQVILYADSVGGVANIDMNIGDDLLTLSPFVEGSFHLGEGEDTADSNVGSLNGLDAVVDVSRSWTGGRGNDHLSTSASSDSFYFYTGDGADVIFDEGLGHGATDSLWFNGVDSSGGALDEQDLWFSRNDDNLLVSIIGSSDQVEISDWYAGDEHKIEEFHVSGQVLYSTAVDQLVSAMSSFGVPAGEGMELPQSVRNDLEPIIASSWSETPTIT